jgi:hypothetical protein
MLSQIVLPLAHHGIGLLVQTNSAVNASPETFLLLLLLQNAMQDKTIRPRLAQWISLT